MMFKVYFHYYCGNLIRYLNLFAQDRIYHLKYVVVLNMRITNSFG
jgi:hypothetical protein